MFILACGYAEQKLKDFEWIKEDEDRSNLEDLEGKITYKEEFEDKVFVIFLLEEYTNSRRRNMKKLVLDVEIRGNIN